MSTNDWYIVKSTADYLTYAVFEDRKLLLIIEFHTNEFDKFIVHLNLSLLCVENRIPTKVHIPFRDENFFKAASDFMRDFEKKGIFIDVHFCHDYIPIKYRMLDF